TFSFWRQGWKEIRRWYTGKVRTGPSVHGMIFLTPVRLTWLGYIAWDVPTRARTAAGVKNLRTAEPVRLHLFEETELTRRGIFPFLRACLHISRRSARATRGLSKLLDYSV